MRKSYYLHFLTALSSFLIMGSVRPPIPFANFLFSFHACSAIPMTTECDGVYFDNSFVANL